MIRLFTAAFALGLLSFASVSTPVNAKSPPSNASTCASSGSWAELRSHDEEAGRSDPSFATYSVDFYEGCRKVKTFYHVGDHNFVFYYSDAETADNAQ